MKLEKIRYSVENGIASVVLNSPENLNALDEAMTNELIAVLDMCSESGEVKVIVISGEGRSFSAGGDIRAMSEALEGDVMDFFGPVISNLGLVALKIRGIGKPVIASVKGAAAGAGANLALLCDFRVAAEGTKFIQAFVNIGLIPDTGGAFLLTRMLGTARATELLMLGRPVSAREALSLGMVNRVVPPEDLERETMQLAEKLRSLPPLALSNMKDLINRSIFQGFEEILDKEAEYQGRCALTGDFREGIRAFIEKRKPEFEGK